MADRAEGERQPGAKGGHGRSALAGLPRGVYSRNGGSRRRTHLGCGPAGRALVHLAELSDAPERAPSLVMERARLAGIARLGFPSGTDAERREIVSAPSCNVTVKDGHKASCQYKRPFGVLQEDPSGAFPSTWWAMWRNLERRSREDPVSVLLLPRARGHGHGVHEGRIHVQQRVGDRIRDGDEAAAALADALHDVHRNHVLLVVAKRRVHVAE